MNALLAGVAALLLGCAAFTVTWTLRHREDLAELVADHKDSPTPTTGRVLWRDSFSTWPDLRLTIHTMPWAWRLRPRVFWDWPESPTAEVSWLFFELGWWANPRPFFLERDHGEAWHAAPHPSTRPLWFDRATQQVHWPHCSANVLAMEPWYFADGWSDARALGAIRDYGWRSCPECRPGDVTTSTGGAVDREREGRR